MTQGRMPGGPAGQIHVETGSPRGLTALVGRAAVLSAAFVLAVGLAACTSGASPAASSPAGYALTNTQADAEFVLAWARIGEACPDASGAEVLQAFVVRGEDVELAPGERVSLDASSPALWGSTRLVREGDPNTGSFRSLAVEISLAEGDAALDEMVTSFEQMGLTLEGSPIAVGVSTLSMPGGTNLVGAAAGRRLMVRVASISTGEMTAYCEVDGVQALVDGAAEQMASVGPGTVQ